MKNVQIRAISNASAFTTRNITQLRQSIQYFIIKQGGTMQNFFKTFLTSQLHNKKKMKKILPLAVLLIVVGIVIVISARTLSASTGVKQEDTSRPTVQGPLSTMAINQEFQFPLKDAKGKEVTKIKYTVESAELRSEIIVKGTKATAIQGRVFLILNLKVANEYDKAIQINARDYLRLSVNGNTNELLAADIHNDPVSVQAISTKSTRLGFPINESDTNLILKVGEITGDKQDIAINF